MELESGLNLVWLFTQLLLENKKIKTTALKSSQLDILLKVWLHLPHPVNHLLMIYTKTTKKLLKIVLKSPLFSNIIINYKQD